MKSKMLIHPTSVKIFFKSVISSSQNLFVFTGMAGSVATVLHDAVMNPAEGKKDFIFIWFY